MSSSPRFFPRKLHSRHAGWVMPLLLSILMTCVVSMMRTLRTVGLAQGVYSL
ncbi:hypothetical protein [Xanthomonas translucens]|uniref:hypothetical protein n=1 Tax=Xanthomonas campestris pv. translucens TaxID=343 RepID=UPI001F1BBE99|nr:hypothetical protein [Xanthomonas translucens]UJB15919.1 hypothetical protein LTC53_04480 [Xanthomonas translucens pv. undulosa]WLA01816.1 hypothetical protein MO330_04460 [Xanthomonas translucens]